MKLTIIIPVYNVDKYIERCLNSIELREDIEIIIIDDCSTDLSVVMIREWINKTTFANITFLQNEVNQGEGITLNRGLDIASGEYIVIIDSDDDFLLPLSIMDKYLDGTDLVYYNLIKNTGERLRLTEETKKIHCGATRFYRREFIGETRRNNKRRYGDADFYYELLAKKPTENFTDIDLYHYNNPRKDSLTDKALKEGIR